MHDHVMHARQPQATRAHSGKSWEILHGASMHGQSPPSMSRPKWLMHMHIKLSVSK